MKAIGLFFFAMMVSLGLCAYNAGVEGDESEDSQKVSIAVLKAFGQKFPQAVGVEWEREWRFYVADFRSPVEGMIPPLMCDMEAWFDSGANWRMTVADVPFDKLPQVVKDGFAGGNYGTWKVDDAHIVERNGKDNIYIIEVEQRHMERDLYFNSRGELVKETKSTDFKSLL